MIYLDHAATSWPKPPEVLRAMTDFLELAGGNPGRSGHRLSIEAARAVYAAREAVAQLFGVKDPLRVVFACNATHALNLALRGILRPGDHVVASSVEHNAVMRPLRALEREGVRLTVAACGPDGLLDPESVARALTPRTRLVALTHASNVCGALQPVAEIAPLVRACGALLLVDAAQTAGAVPLDVSALGADLLAFSGHKSLLGPPGAGGLVLGDRVDVGSLHPLVRGGTGSRSEEEEQPEQLPDKFESGTLNGPGLAGLGAGVRWLLNRGIAALRAQEMEWAALLRKGLSALPGVMVYGPGDPERCIAIVSFTVAGRRVSEIGLRLDEDFGVLSRVGLHCAPAAHRTLGTFPEGTVRLAPGPFTTRAEIEAALAAVRKIVRP
jgi:cysteine desulfurase family protein